MIILKTILEFGVAFATITGWKKTDDFRKEMDALYAPLEQQLKENHKKYWEQKYKELDKKNKNPVEKSASISYDDFIEQTKAKIQGINNTEDK
ncbi:hypothetical protein [Spiroplasma citri]|uniref:Uncharacterized protein n=1 Tax=Spiroplasma citri TaxID=2133 RepID=A0AAJ4EKK8_SPICI|nr:hypothetical protein [Spiroplasma citri]APE75241.1 hypothetical protein SCITRI_001366 [Spiroplasma citri]QED25145.1 hypothetical protein FRX96_07165 [Spiroplasma citri]QIA67483.1 hypothetical protein GMI18_07510 [Spiroplasma citri]QIA69339.1 hypothetical protein GL298_07475 [Spiroplasma citri]QIA71205.1 hypothetical protein GL981_07525 [Spiroplasma citri]